MAIRQEDPVLRYIRKLATTDRTPKLPDIELLERFVRARDEAAFAALVRRHGPMVLHLCLRVLQNRHEAEDAFQATFLVLTRKAASLQRQDSLAGWLYRVAYRIAWKARIAAARRRTVASGVSLKLVADPLAEITLREAHEIFEEELSRLPDRFRLPLVLCYLQDLTRDEAAQQLGWSPSMVKSRLEQARDRLRKRLTSRGLPISGALVASMFCQATTSAAVPAVLLNSTIKAATHVAAGGAAASVVSAKVAALSEGMVKAMFMTKVKIATVALLAALLVGTGVGTLKLPALPARLNDGAGSPVFPTQKGPTQDPAKQARPALQQATLPKEPPQTEPTEFGRHVESMSWALTRVDVEKQTISVMLLDFAREPLLLARADISNLFEGGGLSSHLVPSGRLALDDFAVTKDAKILINGKESGLRDLKEGMRVALRLAPDGSVFTRIDAASVPSETLLKAADVEKNAITVSLGEKTVTLPLRSDTKITILGKADGEFSDLKAGMQIDLQLGVDGGKVVVKGLRASRK
jgi:RNA polymerase sigma factor (sigma-70 family)